jgi:hypothetical protein
MTDTPETTRARRRLRRIDEVRGAFRLLLGAAGGLAVLGLVRLISHEDDVFPTIIVPLLVIVALVGEALTRRRYTEAIEDVELAARNAPIHDTRAAAEQS